ncbi:MAG: adenine phosphoribosyltransferase [Flavobacteriales bacterium]|jgi:adenine phosphoribosyltransferase
MIEDRIKNAVRDVPDFPSPGILFKDITPIFLDPQLCRDIVSELHEFYKNKNLDLVIGVESRGFFFGLELAKSLDLPFAPVRKKGKLPAETVCVSYDLEYGSAEIEIHKGIIKPGMKVLVHDDLLATGGTAGAAADLVLLQGGVVGGFDFLVELSFLKGQDKLHKYSENIHNLACW